MGTALPALSDWPPPATAGPLGQCLGTVFLAWLLLGRALETFLEPEDWHQAFCVRDTPILSAQVGSLDPWLKHHK